MKTNYNNWMKKLSEVQRLCQNSHFIDCQSGFDKYLLGNDLENPVYAYINGSDKTKYYRMIITHEEKITNGNGELIPSGMANRIDLENSGNGGRINFYLAGYKDSIASFNSASIPSHSLDSINILSEKEEIPAESKSDDIVLSGIVEGLEKKISGDDEERLLGFQAFYKKIEDIVEMAEREDVSSISPDIILQMQLKALEEKNKEQRDLRLKELGFQSIINDKLIEMKEMLNEAYHRILSQSEKVGQEKKKKLDNYLTENGIDRSALNVQTAQFSATEEISDIAGKGKENGQQGEKGKNEITPLTVDAAEIHLRNKEAALQQMRDAILHLNNRYKEQALKNEELACAIDNILENYLLKYKKEIVKPCLRLFKEQNDREWLGYSRIDFGDDSEFAILKDGDSSKREIGIIIKDTDGNMIRYQDSKNGEYIQFFAKGQEKPLAQFHNGTNDRTLKDYIRRKGDIKEELERTKENTEVDVLLGLNDIDGSDSVGEFVSFYESLKKYIQRNIEGQDVMRNKHDIQGNSRDNELY